MHQYAKLELLNHFHKIPGMNCMRMYIFLKIVLFKQ